MEVYCLVKLTKVFFLTFFLFLLTPAHYPCDRVYQLRFFEDLNLTKNIKAIHQLNLCTLKKSALTE